MLFTFQAKHIGGDNYAVYTVDKRLSWDRRAAHSHPVTWSGKEGMGVAKVTSQGADPQKSPIARVYYIPGDRK